MEITITNVDPSMFQLRILEGYLGDTGTCPRQHEAEAEVHPGQDGSPSQGTYTESGNMGNLETPGTYKMHITQK